MLALRKQGITRETLIFYYYDGIFIRISIDSMNPSLLCNLYEPWTYNFHPLNCMGKLAHPEGPGSHIKWSIQENCAQ